MKLLLTWSGLNNVPEHYRAASVLVRVDGESPVEAFSDCHPTAVLQARPRPDRVNGTQCETYLERAEIGLKKVPNRFYHVHLHFPQGGDGRCPVPSRSLSIPLHCQQRVVMIDDCFRDVEG